MELTGTQDCWCAGCPDLRGSFWQIPPSCWIPHHWPPQSEWSHPPRHPHSVQGDGSRPYCGTCRTWGCQGGITSPGLEGANGHSIHKFWSDHLTPFHYFALLCSGVPVFNYSSVTMSCVLTERPTHTGHAMESFAQIKSTQSTMAVQRHWFRLTLTKHRKTPFISCDKYYSFIVPPQKKPLYLSVFITSPLLGSITWTMMPRFPQLLLKE